MRGYREEILWPLCRAVFAFACALLLFALVIGIGALLTP